MEPELHKRIEFSKLDNSHPATHCLRLLVDFNISVGKACEYLSKYFLTGQRDPIANEVGPYDPMLDEVAASEIARQLRASREEVSKLSTRIDEYELAETKAVEELARVRDLNQIQRTAGQRMSNLLYNLAQQKRFIEPDAAMMNEAVAEWDAAKAGKPNV